MQPMWYTLDSGGHPLRLKGFRRNRPYLCTPTPAALTKKKSSHWQHDSEISVTILSARNCAPAPPPLHLRYPRKLLEIHKNTGTETARSPCARILC